MAAIAFQSIIAALEAASVRYAVAGGFAVNLHGFLRATQDLDILIDLDPANAALAMSTLTAYGMHRATVVDLGTSLCRVIGLDDLIAMKLAAGRPVDLRDVEELSRLARWQQG